MIGRRVYPDANGWFNAKMEPGEYVRLEPLRNHDGTPLPDNWAHRKGYPYWQGCTPNGYMCALGAHTIEEHEDGTITVSPSILVRTSRNKGETWVELWHGYLERGVWRTC